MTDDKPTLSQCCGAPIRYDLAPQCEACGQRQPSDDLLDQASQSAARRVPGDVHDLEAGATDPKPIDSTVTGRDYRSAVHALWAYLRCRADGAPALDPSPAPSGSVSADAAYVRDVHEARELERIFRAACESVRDHLREGRKQWKTWHQVRVEGESMRDVEGVPHSTVNDRIDRVDAWIEWTLDDWGKLDGKADRPVGIGGDARRPDPETQSVRSEGVTEVAHDIDDTRPEGLRA